MRNAWLTVVLTPLMFAGAKVDDSQQLQLQANNTQLKAEIKYLQQEVECYKSLYEEYYKLNSKKVLKKKKDRNKYYKGTSFLTSSYVRMELHSTLRTALEAYEGPQGCTITSALRPHCKRSLHSKGLAIDIAWNEEGKLLAQWLDSEEGLAWLKKYNISYYLENISSKKEHMNYFYNKWATGPHIHLNVTRR